MADIITGLKVLLELIKVGRELGPVFKKLFGDDPAKVILKIGEGFAELSKANTVEEKQRAASKIQDIIRGL
jgi:hypothetical protein